MSVLILFGCGSNDNALPSPPPNDPPPDQNPPVVKIPDGVWEWIGFGRAINVSGDSIDMYDFTRQTCLMVGSTSQAEFATTLTIDSIEAEEFVATDDGAKLVYSARDSIPAACLDDRLITDNSPVSTLEHTLHNFNDYYPFFEERGIVDWEERMEIARSQVNSQTTDEELLATLIELIADLGDGHVSLTAGDDFEFIPLNQEGKIADVLAQGFQNQSETTDFDTYVNDQFARMFAILDSYFDPGSFANAGGESQDVIQWATIGNGVAGYIEINGMGGISTNSAVSDLAAAEDLMDQVLTDLAHTEALIINVAVNGGGDLAIADAIASRFSTETVTVSAYEAFGYDDANTPQQSPRVQRELAPTDRVSYSRPIATISGPNTYSAAEHFLLSMRALKHPVCFIGERSDGILSAPLDKQLPAEGARLGLSNMVIYDHTGQAFEVVGVPVDIESTTFEVVDSNSDSNQAMDAALSALGFGHLVNRDTQAADCAFKDARMRFEISAP
ncbi:S41 family peptidase [Alteromonas oceanisediminis]|uniref:S41 family peptidase n=1 Tax=Alteromonas oceanisediminis TaxID=2836180 RepID=UPI002023B96B|nr:S41 family peptidase [Alteromonas oceanisediminis]